MDRMKSTKLALLTILVITCLVGCGRGVPADNEAIQQAEVSADDSISSSSPQHEPAQADTYSIPQETSDTTLTITCIKGGAADAFF